MKPGLAICAFVFGLNWAGSALAGSLTADDQAYLNNTLPGRSVIVAQMDSTSQARVHNAIHNPATADNPRARRRAVAYLLDAYADGWLWNLGRP